MYTHAHLRYAEMQAHAGDARGLLESLALAHPVQLRERSPQASRRQANCYFSSSDAAFRDRYQAQEHYEGFGDAWPAGRNETWRRCARPSTSWASTITRGA